MADVVERGVEVDEAAGDAVRTAGQPLRAGEDARKDLALQVVPAPEKLAVLLVARFDLGEVVLDGVLLVVGDHGVQGEARGLLADLDGGIALHEFLAEGGHAQHAAA